MQCMQSNPLFSSTFVGIIVAAVKIPCFITAGSSVGSQLILSDYLMDLRHHYANIVPQPQLQMVH